MEHESLPAGYSVSAQDGKLRIAYRPDWSRAVPFVTYVHGTAGRHFATLADAQRFLEAKHGMARWTQ